MYDWLDWIKFYVNKFLSPKYKISGKCNQCGQCCRMINFIHKGQIIKTEQEFEELKKIDKKYYHFYISGRDNEGNLIFTCKSLTGDNKCRDYLWRSLYCRKYPDADKKFIMAGGELLDGCGYRIGTTKNFSEYLD